MTLVHDPKLPPSSNSGRWKKGYNPDLIFVSAEIATQAIRNVYIPIPNTQHQAIVLSIIEDVRSQTISLKTRFNFKKARWTNFKEALDKEIFNLDPKPENYAKFV